MTDTYLYEAFGNLLSKTGTTENDFLYTGEQYDANTGFYYLRARYMNPSTGTFTSPDAYAGTIFDPVSLHKYLYANANPVMNRDPSGNFTLTEMETAVAIQAIIGAALNSIPSGISRLLNGAPLDGNFWLTFTGDFALGLTMGIGFGWLGYLATQYLLACCLLRSVFGTMGLNFTWDLIQDVRRGDWGRAILNLFGAALAFWGASTNFYRGGGSSSGGVADDAAGAADDVAGSSAKGAGNTVDDFLSSNVPKQFQTQVKNAFGSDAKVTTLTQDTTVYRYYGGDSAPSSYWVTPNKASNPISELALPPGNTAQYVDTIVLKKGTTVLEGTVAPNFGQAGGGYQYYIPGMK